MNVLQINRFAGRVPEVVRADDDCGRAQRSGQQAEGLQRPRVGQEGAEEERSRNAGFHQRRFLQARKFGRIDWYVLKIQNKTFLRYFDQIKASG